MRPNPQETADLVTFTEEILNGKLYFLCGIILTLEQFIFWKALYVSFELTCIDFLGFTRDTFFIKKMVGRYNELPSCMYTFFLIWLVHNSANLTI